MMNKVDSLISFLDNIELPITEWRVTYAGKNWWIVDIEIRERGTGREGDKLQLLHVYLNSKAQAKKIREYMKARCW